VARSIKCPHCGQVIRAGEEAAGKRVDCPACKKAFLAPRALAKGGMPAKPSGPPPVAGSGRVWHLHIDGRNEGPFTADTVIEQLKTGKIGAHTLAWKEGMDDWQQLGQMAEFRGAFSTPPPVLSRPTPKAVSPDEREKHRRYVPGKGKTELMIGIWVAVGMAAILLIVLVVVLTRPAAEPESTGPGGVRPPQAPVAYPGTAPSTATAPKGGPIVIHGPKPVYLPRKQVVVELSKEKLLGNLKTDLAEGFKAAIAAHKKGDRKPIYNLSLKIKSHAEKIAKAKWEGYQSEVDTLVLRLNQASEGIQKELKQRSEAWDLGEGLDEKIRVKQLDLDKFDWLERWQKILDDDLAKISKKGLQF